jgi:hypothetical protein
LAAPFADFSDFEYTTASHEEVRSKLADLAAQLLSFSKSEPFGAWFVSRLGINLREAARILRSIAMQLLTRNEKRPKAFEKLDKALKIHINAGRFYDPLR